MDYASRVACHPLGAILLRLDPDGLETGQCKLIADAVSVTVPLVRLVGPDHHLLDQRLPQSRLAVATLAALPFRLAGETSRRPPRWAAQERGGGRAAARRI